MSLLGLRLTLYLGVSTLEPAPLEITEALTSVRVTQTEMAPSGFQLTFEARRVAGQGDPPLLHNTLLQTYNRAAIVVHVNGTPQVLIDGFITVIEVQPGAEGNSFTMTATGEDVSLKMDLVQVSLEWPEMGDYLIANAVLDKYAIFGIDPDITITATDAVPLPGVTPQQNCTDREYMKQLAQLHGYVFYVQPGPELGKNTAHWGPPVRTGALQESLVFNAGVGGYVESASFKNDALSPALYWGAVEVDILPVPFAVPAARREPSFATRPTGDHPLFSLKGRTRQLQHQGMTYVQTAALALSKALYAVDDPVTVEGQLDGLSYGAVLKAPGIVGVRGASTLYDGIYMVTQVTHQLNNQSHGKWQYKQAFSLARGGLGSTVQEV